MLFRNSGVTLFTHQRPPEFIQDLARLGEIQKSIDVSNRLVEFKLDLEDLILNKFEIVAVRIQCRDVDVK